MNTAKKRWWHLVIPVVVALYLVTWGQGYRELKRLDSAIVVPLLPFVCFGNFQAYGWNQGVIFVTIGFDANRDAYGSKTSWHIYGRMYR